MNPKKPPVSSPATTPRSKPNNSPAVINAHEVYTLSEAARRMRWKRHSIRQAIRAGLVTTKFGSRRYVVGQAVIDLMSRLAEEQAEDKPQTATPEVTGPGRCSP